MGLLEEGLLEWSGSGCCYLRPNCHPRTHACGSQGDTPLCHVAREGENSYFQLIMVSTDLCTPMADRGHMGHPKSMVPQGHDWAYYAPISVVKRDVTSIVRTGDGSRAGSGVATVAW